MPVPEMKEKIRGIELLISEFEDINQEVIEAADKLKIIVCCRNEAFASIDIEAATKKNIPVLRAGGRNAIAVAEHTIALLMAVSKNISLTDHLLKYTDQLTNVYGSHGSFCSVWGRPGDVWKDIRADWLWNDWKRSCEARTCSGYECACL